jgi:hypothetical protein
MNAPLKIGMASALALATASTAFAQQPQYQPYQYDRDTQYQQSAPQYRQTEPSRDAQEQYQNDRRDYEARRNAYDARRDNYESRRQDYEVSRADFEAARRDYERRRAAWERARADYDARYGYGAYIRVYGPAPIWDEARYGPYVAYSAPSATYYGRASTYNGPVTCRNDHSAATAGGILGALAGAALGSNIAAGGHRTDGAILGGVVGAGIGASVGNAHDKYRCDNRGPYFTYNDTIAYREDPRWRSGRYNYSYYSRMRCRLAPAPVDSYGEDIRYVRVCPDRDGRYRITG